MKTAKRMAMTKATGKVKRTVTIKAMTKDIGNVRKVMTRATRMDGMLRGRRGGGEAAAPAVIAAGGIVGTGAGGGSSSALLWGWRGLLGSRSQRWNLIQTGYLSRHLLSIEVDT